MSLLSLTKKDEIGDEPHPQFKNSCVRNKQVSKNLKKKICKVLDKIGAKAYIN